MNLDDDDPWLDEDATAPAVLERNAAQEWDRLSNKFTDVCLQCPYATAHPRGRRRSHSPSIQLRPAIAKV